MEDLKWIKYPDHKVKVFRPDGSLFATVNELNFASICASIAQANAEGYTVKWKNKIYPIRSDGRVESGKVHLFPYMDDCLKIITGF